MIKTGVEFEPIAPCHLEELFEGLGAWYKAANSDIQDYVVVSQHIIDKISRKCHNVNMQNCICFMNSAE